MYCNDSWTKNKYNLLHRALSSPDPLDSLCDANIVRLEFVQSDADQHCRSSESPPEEQSYLGQSLGRDVVDDEGLETNM